MKFAKYVFIAAGVWGIAVLTPLFFLVDITGRPYPAPTDYPHFYYGFLAVAMAWQSHSCIGSNPVRYRLLMIPASSRRPVHHDTTLLTARAGSLRRGGTAIHLLLVLFVVAFLKTSRTFKSA